MLKLYFLHCTLYITHYHCALSSSHLESQARGATVCTTKWNKIQSCYTSWRASILNSACDMICENLYGKIVSWSRWSSMEPYHTYFIPHNVSFSRVHYITHYKSRCGSYGGKVTHSLSPATDASPSDRDEGG